MPQQRRLAVVTIGTDGAADYVQVPDGQRFNLGSVSVLKLVTTLVPMRQVRGVLREFLDNRQVMVSVDLDRMWAMFPYHRARYSSANSLMGRSDEGSNFLRGSTMADTGTSDKSIKEAVMGQIGRIEAQIYLLQQHSKDAAQGSISKNMMESEIGNLQGLISWLRRPSPYGNQSQNSTYYGLPGGLPGKQAGEVPPEFLEQQKKMKDKAKDKDDDKKSDKEAASYDMFKANSELAESIVAKLASTDDAINRLVSAGKRFDSVRAKADLHKIASRVTEISQNVDLAQPWVRSDLTALHKQASTIHGLFLPQSK